MADAVAVRTQIMTAAEFMADEANAAYRALFNWLPSRVSSLFIDIVTSLAGTVTAISTVASNLLAVEVTAGTAACRVHFWDSATGGVTLATLTPAPQFTVAVPADVRMVWPLFAFQSSAFGWAFGTAISVAAVDTTAGYVTAAPAAARPTIRTIATVD